MTPIELYTCIAQSLVASPEDLDINPALKNGRLNQNEITVTTANESDYGRLIGGQGRMFRSCTDLLQACSMRMDGPKITLSILKTESRASFPSKFINKDNWGPADDKGLTDLAQKILGAVMPCHFSLTIVSVPRTAANSPHDASAIKVTSGGTAHEAIVEAMKIILHAVGRVRGRIVYVDFRKA